MESQNKTAEIYITNQTLLIQLLELDKKRVETEIQIDMIKEITTKKNEVELSDIAIKLAENIKKINEINKTETPEVKPLSKEERDKQEQERRIKVLEEMEGLKGIRKKKLEENGESKEDIAFELEQYTKELKKIFKLE